MNPAARAVSERAQGRQPSRLRSLTAAGLGGVLVAVAIYKVLRRPPADEDD